MAIDHCWEITNCGRQGGGARIAELGECIASVEGMTHSCWAVAGTLCGGAVQGTLAQKQQNCVACDVFARYSRTIGTQRREVREQFPEEDKKYRALIEQRSFEDD